MISANKLVLKAESRLPEDRKGDLAPALTVMTTSLRVVILNFGKMHARFNSICRDTWNAPHPGHAELNDLIEHAAKFLGWKRSDFILDVPGVLLRTSC